ncbi:MAG: hypothetical protein WBC17_00495, partial [Mycobacterium sp.]
SGSTRCSDVAADAGGEAMAGRVLFSAHAIGDLPCLGGPRRRYARPRHCLLLSLTPMPAVWCR